MASMTAGWVKFSEAMWMVVVWRSTSGRSSRKSSCARSVLQACGVAFQDRVAGRFGAADSMSPVTGPGGARGARPRRRGQPEGEDLGGEAVGDDAPPIDSGVDLLPPRVAPWESLLGRRARRPWWPRPSAPGRRRSTMPRSASPATTASADRRTDGRVVARLLAVGAEVDRLVRGRLQHREQWSEPEAGVVRADGDLMATPSGWWNSRRGRRRGGWRRGGGVDGGGGGGGAAGPPGVCGAPEERPARGGMPPAAGGAPAPR